MLRNIISITIFGQFYVKNSILTNQRYQIFVQKYCKFDVASHDEKSFKFSKFIRIKVFCESLCSIVFYKRSR